jgi:hypothetical protein
MTSVYHIVTIHVNETFWAHVWRLRFRYLGTGYDNLDLKAKPVEQQLCHFTQDKRDVIKRERSLDF